MLRTKFLGLAALAVTAILSRTARADFASDAVGIVEQLVEDDVATQVVPNAAARVPATCDLLPSTIGALLAKRYNGISSVIRKELADDAGLVVVVTVEGGDFTQLPGLPKTAALRQQTIDILTKLDVVGAKAPPPAFVNSPTPLCSFTGSAAPTQAVSTTVLQACASTQASATLELACALGLAVRDGADGDASLVPADLQKGLVAIASQAVLNAFPKAVTGDATTSQFTKMVQLIQQAEAGSLLPTSLPSGSPQLIQALANQIVVLSKATANSLEQVVPAVGEFAAFSAAAVSPPALAKPLSTELTAFSTIAGGASAVLADIKAKNYGAAASDSFDTFSAVFEQDCANEKNGACSELDQLVLSFLKATAVYMVDSLTAGSVDSSVSSDFRSATVDLIEEIGGVGIRRRTFVSTKARAAGWFIPNFSLRESVRPGFAEPADPGTNSSALVTYASMDWPNFRFKVFPSKRASSPLWLGMNVSFIDAIGPLWELGARNTTLANSGTQSTRNEAFVLGFFVPRVEFEFGVPELTKNLVVGLGGAVRLYRADQSSPLNTTAPVVATYCIAGQTGNTGCNNGVNFDINNFEGTIFVKFVP